MNNQYRAKVGFPVLSPFSSTGIKYEYEFIILEANSLEDAMERLYKGYGDNIQIPFITKKGENNV